MHRILSGKLNTLISTCEIYSKNYFKTVSPVAQVVVNVSTPNLIHLKSIDSLSISVSVF